MATKQVRTKASAEERPAPALAPWDWSLELARQQVAVATEGASTWFRGLQAMQRIQEQAAREASQRRAEVADKLRKPCTPTELLALQTELVRQDLDAATRYWQQVAGAAAELGTELCACGAHLVDTEDVLALTAQRFLHS